ncbi:MAG: TIGR01777 family oxidoreductase [Nitritalea sp.]
MKNILITGGSGLVGRVLTQKLEAKGYAVAWLSRNPEKQGQQGYFWDPMRGELDIEALSWADGIIHLAGAGVADSRWTSARKRLILESRTKSTALLAEKMRALKKRPSVFIGASAIGYYGMDTGDKLVQEADPPGQDFLAQVVVAWEKESLAMGALGLRCTLLRIGIVLEKNGGALKAMLQPPVAAPLGSGQQWMSWIHVEDLAALFIFALEQSLEGIYNAVSPSPATNAAVTRGAASAKGKPYVGIGVPGFALRLVLGEMAQMVLGGNRVSAEKTLATGFQFQHTDLQEALADLFK